MVDVWDDEDTNFEHALHERQARRMKERFNTVRNRPKHPDIVKDGYREGIDHGKEDNLQAFFDRGFASGTYDSNIIGRLQGVAK